MDQTLKDIFDLARGTVNDWFDYDIKRDQLAASNPLDGSVPSAPSSSLDGASNVWPIIMLGGAALIAVALIVRR